MITFSLETYDGKDYWLFFTEGRWRVEWSNKGRPVHGRRIFDTLTHAITCSIWPERIRYCWAHELERAGLSPKTEARE